MQTTTLGRGGPEVSRAGLGLMGMSGIYGEADDRESLATTRGTATPGSTEVARSGSPAHTIRI